MVPFWSLLLSVQQGVCLLNIFFLLLYFGWELSSSLASITSNLTVVMEALPANSGCGETEEKKQLLEREEQGPMLGCLWTQCDVRWLGWGLEDCVP